MKSSGTFLAGALAVALAAVFVASRMGLLRQRKLWGILSSPLVMWNNPFEQLRGGIG